MCELLILSLLIDYITSPQDVANLHLVCKYIHDETPRLINPYIKIVANIVTYFECNKNTIATYKLIKIDKNTRYEIIK